MGRSEYGTAAQCPMAFINRLQVRLRDGTSITTVSNGIRVRNASPTPVPPQPVTPVIAPPIAALLTITFTNCSFGRVDGLRWDFRDGSQ